MLEYIRTKFTSSTKFISQVTKFQIGAIGISHSRPFFAEPVTIRLIDRHTTFLMQFIYEQ